MSLMRFIHPLQIFWYMQLAYDIGITNVHTTGGDAVIMRACPCIVNFNINVGVIFRFGA